MLTYYVEFIFPDGAGDYLYIDAMSEKEAIDSVPVGATLVLCDQCD